MESFCITDGPTMWAVFLHLARPGPNYLKLAMSIILPFERIIAVDGPIEPTLQDKLAEIADKCPVHRTW